MEVLVAPELTEAGRDATPCMLGRAVFFTEISFGGAVLPSNADGPVTSTLSTVTLGLRSRYLDDLDFTSTVERNGQLQLSGAFAGDGLFRSDISQSLSPLLRSGLVHGPLRVYGSSCSGRAPNLLYRRASCDRPPR